MTSNIEYLLSLLKGKDGQDWVPPLRRILLAHDVKEIAGNPQLNRVSFILVRAKMRLSNSTRLKLKTFGLESLISDLERFAPDINLKTYQIKDSAYTGSCFVSENRMIGCEFVARKMAKTVPFN